jgi:hypothetical protein
MAIRCAALLLSWTSEGLKHRAVVHGTRSLRNVSCSGSRTWPDWQLRAISAELAAQGFMNENGHPFSPFGPLAGEERAGRRWRIFISQHYKLSDRIAFRHDWSLG